MEQHKFNADQDDGRDRNYRAEDESDEYNFEGTGAKDFRLMAKPPRRTFTLRDAIVLVAATAVAFAWIRSLDDSKFLHRVQDWLAPGYVGLILAPLTLTVAGLRLLPPRPPLRRLVLQPGAAACGAVAFSFTYNVVYAVVILVLESQSILGAQSNWGGIGEALYHHVMAEAVYDGPVLVAWGLLLLSRRCRPEPSWIDRAGRAIGLTWLLLGLWFWLNFAIETWREVGR